MLDRLHASLEHERRFVADASHELRTPVALLRTELELALRRPRTHEELDAAIRSAAEETERLSRLADDLLLIARGDAGTLPLRRGDVDVEELLETVAPRFANRAESAGASRVDADRRFVDGDPERIEQALGNLVDNALPHGAGEVVISAQRPNGSVELHVTDRRRRLPTRSSPARSTGSAAPTTRAAAAARGSVSRSSR